MIVSSTGEELGSCATAVSEIGRSAKKETRKDFIRDQPSAQSAESAVNLNVFAESGELPAPVSARSPPSPRSVPRWLSAADLRNQIFGATDSCGSGSRPGNRRECFRRCAFSSAADGRYSQTGALRREFAATIVTRQNPAAVPGARRGLVDKFPRIPWPGR